MAVTVPVGAVDDDVVLVGAGLEVGVDLLAQLGEGDFDDVVVGAGQFLELVAPEVDGAGDGAALAGGVDADGELLALPGRIGLALVGGIEGRLGGLGFGFIRGREAADHLRASGGCRRRGDLDLLLHDLGLDFFDDLGLDDLLLDDLGLDFLDDLRDYLLDDLRRGRHTGGEKHGQDHDNADERGNTLH